MNEGDVRVKKSGKFAIALGVFGQSLLTGIVTSYITYFGTDILGGIGSCTQQYPVNIEVV